MVYLLAFSFLIILIAVILLIAFKKRNDHTELYSRGVRNENDGNYSQALRNYEDALKEVRKLKLEKNFGTKIAERIKILRTTIDYEKNFQTSDGL